MKAEKEAMMAAGFFVTAETAGTVDFVRGSGETRVTVWIGSHGDPDFGGYYFGVQAFAARRRVNVYFDPDDLVAQVEAAARGQR